MARTLYSIRKTLFSKHTNIVSSVLQCHFHSSGIMSSKVAVVLSGCGVYDGTEVHEASATLVHLSRGGAEVSMFAPDVDQMHVIDHTKGEPMDTKRNVLVESARIARGKIDALSNLDSSKFDAVILPGGFGAAKNLCTFAVDGAGGMKVEKDVQRVIADFHKESKPIGLCCIAPVLAAKLVPGCEVTVGSDQEEGGRWPYAGTAGAIDSMGSKHIKKNVTDFHVDEKNKIVTTPAFMCETGLHEIFDGIGKMVENVLSLANTKSKI
ncbi:glutamine amidotransferase-like class 1 domain-containing protein 3, mitochondrial [Ylistrum balloti]|uniref:glutamine amidotransferase-like class 1 domain-containing protein 3, mitochondrial n=1 Tax=Ylistrum balloti TaxID=509963 RepID=UPI002905A6CA|nr:glutamine amidotransferase-like class 1 domain-containing protein 3, mitochondrial [Ylistrum balloti]